MSCPPPSIPTYAHRELVLRFLVRDSMPSNFCRGREKLFSAGCFKACDLTDNADQETSRIENVSPISEGAEMFSGRTELLRSAAGYKKRHFTPNQNPGQQLVEYSQLRWFSLQILKYVCAGALARIHATYSLGELVQAPAIVSDSSVSAPFLLLPVVKCLAELSNCE
jgi:hypothetical protein